MVFLARYYPDANIQHFSSASLPDSHKGGNLVVIGGPGDQNCGNDLSRQLMEAIPTRVSYGSDCDTMLVRHGDRESSFQAEAAPPEFGVRSRSIKKDYGYFARFRNPVDRAKHVVLIHGIHTAGVLGAARAFGDRHDALLNLEKALRRLSEGSSGFETYFDVHLLGGEVRVPRVSEKRVFTLADHV